MPSGRPACGSRCKPGDGPPSYPRPMNDPGEARGAESQAGLTAAGRPYCRKPVAHGIVDQWTLRSGAASRGGISDHRRAPPSSKSWRCLSCGRSSTTDLWSSRGGADLLLDEAMARVHDFFITHSLGRSGNVCIRCLAQTHRSQQPYRDGTESAAGVLNPCANV
jgi:hypothetical protein